MKRSLLRSPAPLTAATAALLLGGCAEPLPPSTSFDDSVRVGTFNVQFLPGSSDDESRPKRIAERIKAAQYDIIALNEVFDEEARATFVAELKDEYPSRVEYLGDDAIGSEDSGLMLFSKFPFQPLPVGKFRHEADDVDAWQDGKKWKDVAFLEYDADIFPDNWAAKGAAFVRIKNTRSGRILNVVFTHLQASYPEDEDDLDGWKGPIDARFWQLEDIRHVIEGSLEADQLATEDVLVLGDLNIDGDLADEDLGATAFDRQNLWEWRQRFDTPGGFFTDTLVDVWAFEQSPDDRGLTNMYHWGPPDSPDQGARLDYALRNRPSQQEGPLCVQHMTLAHNMRDGDPFIESGFGLAGVHELSDHIGLNLDLNRHAPHCNPLDASPNPKLDMPKPGTISFPGSVQWYRFDEPGTYAFAVNGDGMDFRVYASTDMSTPLRPYFEETITFDPIEGPQVQAPKFLLAEPPFFVRVFNTDRSATGDYGLVPHRATCNSQEEACALAAGVPLDHTMPTSPVNADDTTWFELHIDKADSGLPQILQLEVDDFATEAFDLELRDADGTSVLGSAVSEPDTEHPGLHHAHLVRDDADLPPGRLYLVVKRKNVASPGFRVRWDTNLTILHGQGAGVPGAVSQNLYCVTETDSLGVDEIHLTVVVDGVEKVSDVAIGDFDDGVYRTMEDLLGTIRYTQQVEVILRDEDGGANGEDDFLTTTIGPLPPGVTRDLGATSVLSCCDGKYLLRHNRSRSLPR